MICAILFYSLLVRLLPFTAFLLNLFPLLPNFSRLLLKRMQHNETRLSDCHNLSLALWPVYTMQFVGLRVFMWDKGYEHLLVRPNYWGRPRQDSRVSPKLTAEACWDFPLCPVSPLVKASWFVGYIKYSGCQAPWHCLNGSWPPTKCCCTLAESGERDAKPHDG